MFLTRVGWPASPNAGDGDPTPSYLSFQCIHYFLSLTGAAMILLQSITAKSNIGLPALNFKLTKRHGWAAALALPLVAGPVWCLAWYASPLSHWLGTLAGFVLLTVLATCAVTDVRSHRIYNWATYTRIPVGPRDQPGDVEPLVG